MAAKVALVEPFYGGSHKQLIDILAAHFDCDLFTLPPTKWHWRMRVSALYFCSIIPKQNYRIFFASSVLNLCELVSLRPCLGESYKVIYFHENQLVYPVRKHQERDFQYGYNQILSCLVADTVVFNSHFNMNSFLESVDSFLKTMPDCRPKGVAEQIRPKCIVIYFPIEFPPKRILPVVLNTDDAGSYRSSTPLHLVWPHRWEHDKGPDEFCTLLLKLLEEKVAFVVSILGSHTNDIPVVLEETISKLGSRVLHRGPVSKEEYWCILMKAHVVVSTAKHEFFGVAMLEASYCGCYPLCPNRLVYPEIFPKECLYNTDQQLFRRVKIFSHKPESARIAAAELQMCYEKYSWKNLQSSFSDLLNPSSD